MKNIKLIIKEWADTIESEDGEEFLNFAQGLNITEFAIENGIKVIWIANGLYNIAKGEAIRETDGEEARAIISELEEYGVEFTEGGAAE